MSRSEHLVAVDNLSQSLSSVRLLDVRWRLGDAPGEGRQRYSGGHVPGARYVDLERVLTAHSGDPLDGRHPLPDIGTLTAGLEEVGVEADDDLVVYDEPGSFAAERAWWVLRWAGLRPRVLDGGLSAWVEAGLPLESGLPLDVASLTPGRASRLDLSVGHLPTIDVDQAAAFPERGALIDARAKSGTAARRSRLIRDPGISRAPSTCRPRSSTRTEGCRQTTGCGSFSHRR
jgi:thiosulfate/3-mercaptopyruvate sulfurtransferase